MEVDLEFLHRVLDEGFDADGKLIFGEGEFVFAAAFGVDLVLHGFHRARERSGFFLEGEGAGLMLGEFGL